MVRVKGELMRELMYRLQIIFPKWMINLFLVSLLGFSVVAVLVSSPNIRNALMPTKLVALKEAIRWDIRAFLHSEDGFVALLSGGSSYSPIDESGGIVLGVTKTGGVLIDTYSTETHVEAVLADLIIDDPAGVAEYLNGYKYQHVLMDSYLVDGAYMYVVRLRDGTPLNLLLIEKKLAHAHPNPPTSIVDRMMATYWWNVFNGEVDSYEVY
ncbi:hypothetical protein [Pseudoalteromonas sp. MEBiC 03485]|uniref:hypothetical protein n=1 Tax=Pseudoalteromonas sp. MEBiC 03485 TaxID=2571103 RepID=UPI0010222C2F|nr:hypothetical protein [Pseudoalteromonas sp. MEBiC 03485]RZD19639.1 hypothetical protein EVU92_20780 [Pseudoalteromonas sp. MEBiC 03485]